jgi:excisionase family DNA binding protein
MGDRSPLVEPQVFTLEQAAKVLRIGRSTFYRLVKEQRVPHRVLPTGVRVLTQADIDAILEEAHRPAVA